MKNIIHFHATVVQIEFSRTAVFEANLWSTCKHIRKCTNVYISSLTISLSKTNTRIFCIFFIANSMRYFSRPLKLLLIVYGTSPFGHFAWSQRIATSPVSLSLTYKRRPVKCSGTPIMSPSNNVSSWMLVSVYREKYHYFACRLSFVIKVQTYLRKTALCDFTYLNFPRSYCEKKTKKRLE